MTHRVDGTGDTRLTRCGGAPSVPRPMNPAAEGTVYPDVAFVVDPGAGRGFREVFGQTEGVPPTFVTAAEFTVFPQVMGTRASALDFTRVVHGSQEYLFERPLREGETLVRPRPDRRDPDRKAPPGSSPS